MSDEAKQETIAEEIKRIQAHDPRGREHPNYPKSDWRYEVANDDTLLGYWEWVAMRLEVDSRDDRPVSKDLLDIIGAEEYERKLDQSVRIRIFDLPLKEMTSADLLVAIQIIGECQQVERINQAKLDAFTQELKQRGEIS